ncbi:ATP-binding cassette domain-containing protein [Actinobacteria bacterium YIM 96077]|uniref:ABC transporter ATP-binding protein n=1 Tax=Phytoactinopolyspora halophila TaxID=1981511 RepID=A0A329R422_9ACTN|nr:ATP-binding cassette domain-containing protein [Phytoactinopolyspora halophila]AYY12030.1 ATP-binding cassette domain-containing protein [Actinobacteria bacterium YIM 96077]RAW18736.1 ABC transporter ATP-binding protein [Phytoactinopolyspora halophila]
MSLTAVDVTVGYRREKPVLDGARVTVAPGEVVGLVGPSGCGKSTLARVLALLLAPWSGRVELDGECATRVRHRAPRRLRTAVGVTFQSPRRSVDPRFTVADTVAEPLRSGGAPERDVEARVVELITRVDLARDLLSRRAHEISDGQLQRACLARALAWQPRYLVCDEMTSMLDASTAAALVRVVNDEVAERGMGVLAVSHDRELLDVWADRLVDMVP